MQLKVSILRAVKVPMDHLRAAADAKETMPTQEVERLLKERYGPMAFRFKIYWSKPDSYAFATAGIECACFDISEAHIPQAGIVQTDPLSKEETLMADGALLCELTRIGIFIEPKTIHWALTYSCSGN